MIKLSKKQAVIIGLIIAMLTAGGTAGFFFHQVKAQNNLSGVDKQELNNFQKLFLILDVVKKNYVEQPDMDKLLTGAIKGMLNSLDDPYTAYLPPNKYEDMQEDISGEYSGIGILITLKNDQLTIVSPFKGTPGDKAGLEPGDKIVEINGTSTDGMKMEQAVKRMKGKAGTDVTLTIKREVKEDDEAEEENQQAENKPIPEEEKKFKQLEVDITRAKVEIPFVTSELKKDKIGYIQLSRFIEDAGVKIEERINELDSQGAEAFILDLRNNPGGLLQESAKVASNFLSQGPIVEIKNREGTVRKINLVNEINHIEAPLVVLVNKGSASASEIVSGAIQDYERGLVVGTNTFGKGVVQSVVPLSDDSAVKLTTARYYTPKGRFIHHEGIEPDHVVELNTDNKEDEQLQKAVEILQTKLRKE